MKLESTIGFTGKYTLHVTRENGDIEELSCNNIITESGMRNDSFSLLFGNVSTIYLGDDNTTPLITDTGCTNSFFVKSSATSNTTNIVELGYRRQFITTTVWELDAGEAIGTVREVAANTAWGNATHSLLTDTAGNPAEIVLTETDQLTITYVIIKTSGLLDDTRTFNLLSTDRSVRTHQVNGNRVTGVNTVAFNSNTSILLFTKEIPHSLEAGEVFNSSDYDYTREHVSLNNSTNTGGGIMDIDFTIPTSLGNGIDIYAIGLYYDQIDYPHTLITFRNSDNTSAAPLQKTEADLIDFSINITCNGANV